MSVITFQQLAINASVLRAVADVGYETPSPIQAQAIPVLLDGRDLIGQAQTGTGKTAAFALPLLSRIDIRKSKPQALVLAPTRELALQVAEAFQSYSRYLKDFHVLPIYGGQDMRSQLRQLKRGAHVIVGTPGRLCDHLRRKSLDLGNLAAIVLDEADEMLRMGFIDDVEWILQQAPSTHQTALFSATMPQAVKRIAQKHLREPVNIQIKAAAATVDTVEQKYWLVQGLHKLDALTRILEVESFDAMLVFVRTKTATLELSEKLAARGYSSAPINGDLKQQQREQTIQRLKDGRLDVLVATDVAARGLDVDRISHVINYDIPYDAESYVHRIGRTGRAGRSGVAVLFVAPRERRMLKVIEKATRKRIDGYQLPTVKELNERRIERFNARVKAVVDDEDLQAFNPLVDGLMQTCNTDPKTLMAALTYLAQREMPLLMPNPVESARPQRERRVKPAAKKPRSRDSDLPMEKFRLAVGKNNNVTAGDIVGAIANEAGVEGRYIGSIRIFDDHSLVDLPQGMPKDIFQHLKKVRIRRAVLGIERLENRAQSTPGFKKKKTAKKRSKP